MSFYQSVKKWLGSTSSPTCTAVEYTAFDGVQVATVEDLECCGKWLRAEKIFPGKQVKRLVRAGRKVLQSVPYMYVFLPPGVKPVKGRKIRAVATQPVSFSAKTEEEPLSDEALWQAMKEKFKLSDDLTAEQRTELLVVLRKNLSAFAVSKVDIGMCDIVVHEIDTGSAKPVKLKPYRLSYAEEQEAHRQIAELVAAGRVKPCNSPWAFPVVMVPKKDGVSLRMCIDYRALNKVTKPWSYPLPYIQDVLERLGKSSFFAVCDVLWGFWNVPIRECDKDKTAFVTRAGQWRFEVMPFGLINAPATFQCLMNTLFDRNVFQNFLEVFIDDLCIHGSSWDEFVKSVDVVLAKLIEGKLKLSSEKCLFGHRQVGYLGHLVSKDGTSPDPKKVEAAMQLLPPRTVTEVRAFLGLVGYYRRFISSYSLIAKPLNQLMQKDVAFEWGEKQQKAFENLKGRLLSAPILARPDPQKSFILDTDYQKFAIAAVLSQVGDDGLEHVIAYASKGLSKAAQRWPPYEGEMFAVVWGIDKFRHYLDNGLEFLLRTDHKPLLSLPTTANPTRKVAGWITKLQGYRYKVQYRQGKSHSNADGLSRARSANFD
jgi:hypothetical protein